MPELQNIRSSPINVSKILQHGLQNAYGLICCLTSHGFLDLSKKKCAAVHVVHLAHETARFPHGLHGCVQHLCDMHFDTHSLLQFTFCVSISTFTPVFPSSLLVSTAGAIRVYTWAERMWILPSILIAAASLLRADVFVSGTTNGNTTADVAADTTSTCDPDMTDSIGNGWCQSELNVEACGESSVAATTTTLMSAVPEKYIRYVFIGLLATESCALVDCLLCVPTLFEPRATVVESEKKPQESLTITLCCRPTRPVERHWMHKNPLILAQSGSAGFPRHTTYHVV